MRTGEPAYLIKVVFSRVLPVFGLAGNRRATPFSRTVQYPKVVGE